jgi:hypothetical protein
MVDEKSLVLTFEDFLRKCADLKNHILYDLQSCSAWINETERHCFINDANLFISAILDISVNPLLLPQQTISHQGALGGTAKTFDYVQKLNHSKDNFKIIAKRILLQEKQQETTLIHQILYEFGHSNIKLKQVFRHIPSLCLHPRRISFSTIRHNSKQKINKSDAIERLKKVGSGMHVEVQLKKYKNVMTNTLFYIGKHQLYGPLILRVLKTRTITLKLLSS